MCYIPDNPTLSPLPIAANPLELPAVEPEPVTQQIMEVYPSIVDEHGRMYYPHPEYAYSAEVPMDRRYYVDSKDDEEEVVPHQMANNRVNHVDYETEEEEEELMGEDETPSVEEEEMEEDKEELAPNEDEEQEPGAKVDSPPPHQPIQPPWSSESFLYKSVEDRMWKRLREAELALKKKDDEIFSLRSKAEKASRQAQQWEYVAKRIASEYMEAFDRFWRRLKHLQMAPTHEQTPSFIDHMTSILEKEYDLALAAEKEGIQVATDHASK